MKELKRFTIGLGVAFGLPWLLLVMIPWAKMNGFRPVAYGDADGEVEAPAFPTGKSGHAMRGYRVYAEEGCTYCHTQMVRPTYAGSDMWRPGWGGREEEGLQRETRPRDFVGEKYAFLGVHRVGPDLSNVGWRKTDEAWHHLHLYNPRSISAGSVMPSYGHLYEVKSVEGGGSDNALELSGEDAPEAGFEVVPTTEARALVDYILSLKKDYKVPMALQNGDGVDTAGDGSGT